jgi:hypothetical protein
MSVEAVSKKPLDLEKYSDYGIPQEYMAFEVKFINITQEQCDDLEAQYHLKGYKIFHVDINRSISNLFDYKIIIAKLEMIF